MISDNENQTELVPENTKEDDKDEERNEEPEEGFDNEQVKENYDTTVLNHKKEE